MEGVFFAEFPAHLLIVTGGGGQTVIGHLLLSWSIRRVLGAIAQLWVT